VLLFLACCRESIAHFFERHYENENGKCKCCRWCCRCLCSCTTEFVLIGINFLVFILFAFSWAIILGIKFSKHLNNVIAQAANKALNDDEDVEYYDFSFDTVKVGKSIWPLAVASLLSLIVTLYLMFMVCCFPWCPGSPMKDKQRNTYSNVNADPDVADINNNNNVEMMKHQGKKKNHNNMEMV